MLKTGICGLPTFQYDPRNEQLWIGPTCTTGSNNSTGQDSILKVNQSKANQLRLFLDCLNLYKALIFLVIHYNRKNNLFHSGKGLLVCTWRRQSSTSGLSVSSLSKFWDLGNRKKNHIGWQQAYILNYFADVNMDFILNLLNHDLLN